MPAIIAIFFLSGAVGLVYEVVWAKYLALFLGNTSHAQAIVLATFLGGLAIGNALVGKRADRHPHPLKLYGWLELGIGALAALSPFFIGWLADGYLALAQALNLDGAAALAVKMLFAAVALLPATILMGGTLPALGRYLTRSMGALTGAVSGLYFLNSFGAVAGSLLAGFYLIPAIGLDRAVWLGAAINGLIALAAFALAQRLALPVRAEEAPDEPEAVVFGEHARRLVTVAVLVSGFVSLAFEIAWIRLLALVMGSSTYSFSIMLSAFVAGIALGSFLVNRKLVPGRNPLVQFALAELALAATVLATLPFYDRLPYAFFVLGGLFHKTAATFYLFEGLKFAFAFGLMIIPTTFLGMTLPLATRVVTRSVGEVGAQVGRIFSANTLGNVLGALATSLFLLPALGLRGLIEAGVAVTMAIGLAAWWAVEEARPSRRAWVTGGALVAFVLAHVLLPSWDMNLLASGPFRSRYLVHGDSYEAYREVFAHQTMRYYKDDSSATVAVIEEKGELRLDVNGKTDASSHYDLPTQVMVGQMPFFVRPKAEDVFLIGLGSGVTAGSILSQPVKSLTAVEISGAIAEGARLFAPYNHHVHDDPRMHLHVDDALSFLQTKPASYDAIVCQPSNPWVAGNANLFTRDFYRTIKQRLRPEGVVVQWLQNYEIDNDAYRMILRTFSGAFKHVSMWQVRSTDWVLVGSDAPMPIDYQAAEARFGIPSVRDELARINVNHFSTVLSMHMANEAEVRRAAGAGQVNELRWPVLEYRAPLGFYLETVADAPYKLDRRGRMGGAGLHLPRYLAERGAPMSQAELHDVLGYHKRAEIIKESSRPYLAELRARFPQDAAARWQEVAYFLDAGQDRQAWEALQAVLREAPNEPAVVSLATKVHYKLLKQDRNMLARPDGAYEALLARARRLVGMQPDQLIENEHLLGRVLLLGERLPEALMAYERAAAAAEGPARAALLAEAAQEAYDRGADKAAAAFAAKALEADPANAQAEALGEAIVGRAL